MNSTDLKKRVLEALTPRGSRILPFRDLAKKVWADEALDEAREGELRPVLDELERRGELVRVRGEKWSRIEFTEFKAGTLAVRGESKGFLLSGERGVPDTPIAKGGLATALDGDFVLARVEKDPKGKRGERLRVPREVGTVVKVLVRKRDTVVGKVARGPEGTFLDPFDKRIDVRLRIPDGKDLGAPTGVFAEARILSYPDDRRLAVAEILETIGFEGEPGVDVEVIARKWGIPRVYPQEAVAEAERMTGLLSREEMARRTDLTSRVIVTIDGETARDFDDAIEAERLPGGGWRLGVHIADVSFYVTPGTAIDAEAYARGTSVYFPDRAIHMLPEALSANLCSLRPDEDRRTVSAFLTVAPDGEVTKSEFDRTLIRSKKRLTYTDVGAFFEGAPPESRGMGPDVAAMLGVAREAGRALNRRRVERGSLDFDLPDSNVVLSETGDIVAVKKAVRNEAHRLIEEFMLAANEAVAKHLQFVPVPSMYRVHDKPDESRLVDLRAVLEPLGYDIPEDEEEVTPKIFQAILDQADGQPEERFVSDLVLRAQKKALYSPECRGHYALAAPYYAHFTSPIRRYPDLLVHRGLTDWIASRRPPSPAAVEGWERYLEDASTHLSSMERRAESAEREALSWKKFVFLSKRVGEEFTAYVSAVVSFGLFVLLEDVYVEGLVPVDSLEDDFYRYEDVEHRLVGSSSGRVYRLGDRLRVKLTTADFDRRQLAFKPVAESAGPRRKSRVEAVQRAAARRPKPKRRT